MFVVWNATFPEIFRRYILVILPQIFSTTNKRSNNSVSERVMVVCSS